MLVKLKGFKYDVDNGYTNEYEVVSHYGFNFHLHFFNDENSGKD